MWNINFKKGAYTNIPRAEYEIYNVSGRCDMANIEDCPGFETFGADVKAARQAKRVSRKAMAEKINIDWRGSVAKFSHKSILV